MKKHEFKTSNGEFVMVDLLESPSTIYHTLYGEKLELICKLSGATEEDAESIIDEPEYTPCSNCLSGCPVCSGYGYSISWIRELHSLLTSKGININNGNWYLFKKV